MTKQEIRFAIKQLKATLSQTQKENDAIIVKQKIEKSLWFKCATEVLTYNALPDELQTEIQLHEWFNNKRLHLPRVNGDTLDVLPAGDTTIGSFNIKEPIGNTLTPTQTIDLAIIPGIAFDRNGARLGRGKGYYDKLLQNMAALKIGICYDFQLLEKLPLEPHDICMDAIITPSHSIIINNEYPWL